RAFIMIGFFFSSRRRHTRFSRDWSSDVCSSDLVLAPVYDPVCITAFFDHVPPGDYGVNRAIDARLRLFSWDDLAELLKQARVPQIGRASCRERWEGGRGLGLVDQWRQLQ